METGEWRFEQVEKVVGAGVVDGAVLASFDRPDKRQPAVGVSGQGRMGGC